MRKSNKLKSSCVEALESRTMLSGSPRVAAYLPDYRYSASLLNQLDWNTLTQVDYFSIRPNANGTIPTTTSGGVDMSASSSALNTLVNTAHGHNVNVDIVVGGYGLDDTLNSIIEGGKTQWDHFAQQLQTFANTHHVDGVILDWEPSSPSSTDISDYGGLLAAIKSDTTGLQIGAAVNAEKVSLSDGGSSFILNPQGVQSTNFIDVMAYDLRVGSGFSPVDKTEQDLTAWGSYVASNGGSTSQVDFALPFYGRNQAGDADVYSDLTAAYKLQYGTLPATNLDTYSIGSNTWYVNSPATIGAKTDYALDNHFGGVAIWDIGQDLFTGSGYDSTYSLFPQIGKSIAKHQTSTPTTTTGSITGTFFLDANGNGKWDSGESTVPSWQVYLDTNNDGVRESSEPMVVGNNAGQYTFSNLPGGNYSVRAMPASGWTQTFPTAAGTQHVSLSAGQTAAGVNFGELHGTVTNSGGTGTGTGSNNTTGSISGTFFLDSNGNGKWDSGEAASPYWQVYIDANNNGVRDANETLVVGNAAGQFTFSKLPAGTYTLRAATASGWTQTTPAHGAADIITLSAGQTVTGINFGEYHGTVGPTAPAAPATGSISGTFFYDSNGNGAWDNGESISPSWLVYIDTNNDGVYDANDIQIRADASGHFTFSGLAAGTYVIRARTASGWTQTTPANGAADIATLSANQTITGVNFGERQIG